jgi:cell division protein FtsZ
MNEACSLIEEAADPEANIIFGSVIDAHAGDEVRITVIATGFQPLAQTEPVAPVRGHSHTRRGHDQMALPMQAQAAPPPLATFGSAPTMAIPTTASAQPPVSWAQSGAPTARGYAAAAAPRNPEPLSIPIDNLDDFYVGGDYSAATPAPVAASPSSTLNYGSVPTAEWTPPAERPIIRPPVSGPGPQGRRMSSPAPVRAADELGVEESEFDKPTYLRRGLNAPE